MKKHNNKNKKDYIDISIILNKSECELLLKSLDLLKEKNNIVYKKLCDKIKNINLIWERKNKNIALLNQK